ncbi:hypothetical protein ACFL59_07640 [Planctomycetota bacterium]
MVLESLFPENVVVMGDIDRSQAERILPWAESVLERDLELPLLCDDRRLWRRVSAACVDEREAELASRLESAPFDAKVERSTYDPRVEPVWREIERQRCDTRERDAVARAYSRQLRGLCHSSVEASGLLGASRKRLLNRLYSVSERHGLTLTQEAWTAIEQQALHKQLLALTLLACLDSQELNSWLWRTHLLESPDLWETLSELDSGLQSHDG